MSNQMHVLSYDVEETRACTDYSILAANINPISVGFMKNKRCLVNERCI